MALYKVFVTTDFHEAISGTSFMESVADNGTFDIRPYVDPNKHDDVYVVVAWGPDFEGASNWALETAASTLTLVGSAVNRDFRGDETGSSFVDQTIYDLRCIYKLPAGPFESEVSDSVGFDVNYSIEREP